MGLLLTAPPVIEPISLAEAKAYLRIDATDEDALIGTLIASARAQVERTCGLTLNTQGWSLFLDAWPGNGAIALPLAPVRSVGAIKLHDAAGGHEVMLPADYTLDLAGRPARIVVTGERLSPGRRLNGIEIAFLAGFGDGADDVPAPIRQALLLLVAHGFERREPVAADEANDVPMTVASLLAPWREMRL